MKWILILTVASTIVTPTLLTPLISYAQDEDEFTDFDQDFSEVESSEDFADSNTSSTDEASEDDFFVDENDSSTADEISEKIDNENDDEFFAEEDPSQNQNSAEEFSEDELDKEMEAEKFTSEEVFIDEGGEEVLEEPAPTQEKMADENATPAVEPPIEETPQQPIANNEPDLQYEAKLYDIYSRFHSQAMSDEEWDYIAGAKLSEVYTIHKGDTLWDLSKTFFGDGNYWPKIWSVNSSIKNPHLIEPQNVIRFILGSENEPPMFTVTEGKS